MPSIDNGQMLARQRELFARADQGRADLWSHIDETIQVAKASGASHQQIAKTYQHLLGPLKQITMSSGRDGDAITSELALLHAKPVAPPASAPDWSFAEHPDVERFSRAMAIAPHDSDLSAAFADRLRQALQSKG